MVQDGSFIILFLNSSFKININHEQPHSVKNYLWFEYVLLQEKTHYYQFFYPQLSLPLNQIPNNPALLSFLQDQFRFYLFLIFAITWQLKNLNYIAQLAIVNIQAGPQSFSSFCKTQQYLLNIEKIFFHLSFFKNKEFLKTRNSLFK